MPVSKENESCKMSRRQALALGGSAVALAFSPGLRTLLADEPTSAPATQAVKKRFPIAADDLFLLQRQKIKAFGIAQKCGLDGISVDMGGMPGGAALNDELKKPEVRQQFLDESKKTGMEICSLAFFGMYAHIYADMPIAVQITEEWVDLMDKMNVKVGFIAADDERRHNERAGTCGGSQEDDRDFEAGGRRRRRRRVLSWGLNRIWTGMDTSDSWMMWARQR